MIWKTWLSTDVTVNLNETIVVQYDNNIEFALIPQSIIDLEEDRKEQTFDIVSKKGEYEIWSFNGCHAYTNFDSIYNTVYFESCLDEICCSIRVITNIDYKKTGYVCVPYTISLTSQHMRFLNNFDYNEGIITLPYYSMLKLKYYVKKVDSDEVDIIIQNPYDVKINGQSGDFTKKSIAYKDLDLNLKFEFDPSVLQLLFQTNDESQSIVPKNIPSKASATHPSLYEIMSDSRFADVFLLSEDKIEIPSSRSILAKYSPVFAKLFTETSEIPAKVAIKNYNSETIISALKFCFGTPDGNVKRDPAIFSFINKYEIFPLPQSCCVCLNTLVDTENVCDIIQIAYSNNFTELKQKCLKLLAEAKMLIDPSKFKELPKDILVDLLYM